MVGNTKLGQDAVEQLKLPCNSVQLGPTAQGIWKVCVCVLCVCVHVCVCVCACVCTHVPSVPTGGQSEVL